MDFLDIAKELIPGYEHLSHDQHLAFMQTSAGKVIASFVYSLKPGFWNLDHPSTHKAKAQQKLNEQKAHLLAKLQNQDAFLRVRAEIICAQAIKKYPYLKGIMDDIDQMLERLPEEFNDEADIERVLTLWHEQIFSDDYTFLFCMQRAQKWVEFFPLLAHRSTYSPRLIIDELVDNYQHERGGLRLDILKNEHKQLTEAIFLVLHKETMEWNAYLHHFNFNEAQKMADAILTAFNEDNPLPLAPMLESYRNAMVHELGKKMRIINGREWALQQMSFNGALFSTVSSALDQMADRLALMADGHAIIQATGFATQNENSHLAFLDFINYWRYAQKLSELKTIVAGLLQPLLPLYLEYRSIALNEKNIFFKQVRVMIPAIIMAAFVVGVFSLLSTFALPELAALVVLIPTLYLGAILATKYIEIRNNAYQWSQEIYFGGHYETPYYQINTRMLEGFGDLSKAEIVRSYYVDELKKCDHEESLFKIKEYSGTLTTFEIVQRKENTTRKNKLSMEWIDIHSNKAFGVDKIQELAKNRFQQDCDAIFQKLNVHWMNDDLPKLKVQSSEVVARVRARFENIEPTVTPRFFKPHCLVHKNELEAIDLALRTATL